MRAPEDYAKEHIKGAVNIPFGKLGENIGKIPYDKTLVLNCYSGQTAGISVVPLRAAGYKVLSISKGFPSAKEGGFAVDAAAVEFKPTEAKKFDEKTAAAVEGIKEAFDALVKQNAQKTLIVDAKEVKALLDAGADKYVVLDLRKPEDFEKSHIKGAQNVPLGKLGEAVKTLPKDKTVVLYCYSGQTAGLATVPLKSEGFKLVSISKGFPGAEAGGFALEKK